MADIDTQIRLIINTCIIALIVAGAGCRTTQKTPGEGMMSVVAQNVVRVAGFRALQDADLSVLSGKPVRVEVSGFLDEHNRDFLGYLFNAGVERGGGRTVGKTEASIILRVVVNNAGVDQGDWSIPIIAKTYKTTGTVDADLIFRAAADGAEISRQHIRGEAKYEELNVAGFQGSGTYFVRDQSGEYVKVPDPVAYR